MSPRRLAPLLLVVAVQLLILAGVPARKLMARASGAEVTLQTRPVDPYDVLSGYYVTLAYEVERAGADVPRGEGDGFVVVERAEPAWRYVRYAEAPGELTVDQVALRARHRYGRVELVGAGRLYIPEARRHRVEEALQADARRALVDLRVGDDGELALIRLRADGEIFGEQ